MGINERHAGALNSLDDELLDIRDIIERMHTNIDDIITTPSSKADVIAYLTDAHRYIDAAHNELVALIAKHY